MVEIVPPQPASGSRLPISTCDPDRAGVIHEVGGIGHVQAGRAKEQQHSGGDDGEQDAIHRRQADGHDIVPTLYIAWRPKPNHWRALTRPGPGPSVTRRQRRNSHLAAKSAASTSNEKRRHISLAFDTFGLSPYAVRRFGRSFRSDKRRHDARHPRCLKYFLMGVH